MNPYLNLLHLKFFCDTVTYKSVSEAAKVNFVTQSTVSQAIAKIEQILGTELMMHSRQKVQFTKEGEILFEQARNVFKAVQEIYDKINHNKENVSGSVQFACLNSIGMSFIAPSYKKMLIAHPQVKLNIKLGNPNFIRSALRNNQIDFGVVVNNQDYNSFEKIILKKGSFHLYCHKDANLGLDDGILVDSLDGLRVADLREHLHRTAGRCTIQAELAGWEVVARFTEKKIGIGFFPDFLIADDRYEALQTCQALPHLEYEICAIYNKGEKLTRAAQAFLSQFSLE